MPGIVGFATKRPRAWAEPQLLKMVETIRHEAFYVSGMWMDEELGIYVGWVARKDSFAEKMPVCNERGDVILVFSGEDFPDPSTGQRLKERGHVLDDSASYLVHLYEEEANFPGTLNGRFHGLLIDRGKRVATLFNDRFGMHRVYYHEGKEAFYFAAEAKAILTVCPELRRCDYRGLGEYVSCGCVLENRTIFQGLRALPPASAWSFQCGMVERKRAYFQASEWEGQGELQPESYYQLIREVFTRNLPRYFTGQQKIGMSLTGGLDTRMIMAWREFAPKTLPCYSFGGMYRDCQDVAVARRVAKACGQKHEVIRVGQEFLSRFAYYADRAVYLSDGCVDVSRSADLFVNERARDIAPVRMTGNYGGEVLRAIRAFKPAEPIAGVFQTEFLQQVQYASQAYANVIQVHPVSFAVFRQAPWHHYGLLSLEQTQLCVRTPYLDNEFVRAAFRSPQSAEVSRQVCLRLIADGVVPLTDIRTDRGLAGDQGAVVRSLNRVLLETTFKAEYAYDYGMPQWLARVDHTFSALHLERLFLGRHKFAHFRVWYRDVLSEYVREMLLDSRSLARPYLIKAQVERLVTDHLNGTRNYTTSLHKLLTLELIHRRLLDC